MINGGELLRFTNSKWSVYGFDNNTGNLNFALATKIR
jgi:hypothetical protein